MRPEGIYKNAFFGPLKACYGHKDLCTRLGRSQGFQKYLYLIFDQMRRRRVLTHWSWYSFLVHCRYTYTYRLDFSSGDSGTLHQNIPVCFVGGVCILVIHLVIVCLGGCVEHGGLAGSGQSWTHGSCLVNLWAYFSIDWENWLGDWENLELLMQ